jgi:hypothetical protein
MIIMKRKILVILLALLLVMCSVPVLAQSNTIITAKADKGTIDYSTMVGIFVTFSEPVFDTNEAALTFIEDSLTDYIILNGYKATEINGLGTKSAIKGIQIHYVRASGKLNIYIAKGAAGELDLTLENYIVFKKEMPIAFGKTLGRNLKLIYNPATTDWTTTIVSDASIATPNLPVMMFSTWGQGITEYGWSDEVDLKFLNQPLNVVPDSGTWKTNVEDGIKDYITINNKSADYFASYVDPNKQFQSHYDTAANNFFLYIGNSVPYNLNPGSQNYVLIDEHFPMVAGTLGRTIAFIYNPSTGIWRQTGQKKTLNVTGMIDYGWSKGVDFWFSQPVMNGSGVQTFIENSYDDYLLINGYNAAQLNQLGTLSGTKSLQMHYDSDTNRFMAFIATGTAGEMDSTTQNTIIVKKELPMADGTTLGVNLKAIYNPTTTLWTTSVLDDIDMPQELTPINVISPSLTELGMLQLGWATQVDIDFLNQPSDIAPDNGILATNVEDYYSSFMTVNSWLGSDIAAVVNANKQFQMHYDTTGYKFWLFIGKTSPFELVGETTNTIILNKNFPLKNGQTLGKTIKFTYFPAKKIWKQSVVAETVNLSAYNVSDVKTITSVSANMSIADFIYSITLPAGYTINVVPSDSNQSWVGTGTLVDFTYSGKTVEYSINIFGDINGDGDISVGDLAILKQKLLNINDILGNRFAVSDIDKNGKISITDLLLVKKDVLGIQNISQN